MVLIPGAEMISDPVELAAPPLAHLSISLFLPEETGPPTMQAAALHPITYVAGSAGNFTGAAELEGAVSSPAYYWLSGIDVASPSSTGAVVAIGDSITDAVGAQGTDQSWPSLLAARLVGNRRTANLSLVNVGVSGNRLMADGAGVSGLARVERHVLNQPGVRWVILLEGINDIGGTVSEDAGFSADDVINAYRQILEKAHSNNVKVVGCTLLPYKGAFYYREGMAHIRREVNEWIRKSGQFDAVVDLDAVMRDPADPEQIRAELQRGDHLHPNAAGYQAMANSFDLSIFSSRK